MYTPARLNARSESAITETATKMSGECVVSVEVPQGVVVSSREPMLSGAEHYRSTGVKFTGTKLTTKRGGTKRRR